MKWTLSGICYYLIWFFAVGTTACSTTHVHKVSRADFEALAQHETRTSAKLETAKKKTINVDKDSRLFVAQKSQERRLVPFAFTIDEELITPLPAMHPEKQRTPFNLGPDDKFEVRSSETAVGRTVLLSLGILLAAGLIMIILCENGAEGACPVIPLSDPPTKAF